MKEFVEYLAKQLVDNQEAVKVNEVSGERVNIYELQVGQGDLGKVIGKGGQNARAMRLLLTAASKKTGKNSMLEILE